MSNVAQNRIFSVVIGRGCLLCLDFLLHVYKLLVAVVELVLQEGQLLRRYHPDAQSVFHLPLALHAEDALVNVGSDIGVYVQIELVDSDLVDQSVNFILESICEQNAGFDRALSETGRTYFLDVYAHGWTDTLTGNLHQTELRKR